MRDKFGNNIKLGDKIKFDQNYFVDGLIREVKMDKNGELGFEAIPNVSKELCYLSIWLNDIEIYIKNN